MPSARTALRMLLLASSASAFSAGDLHVIASGTLVETFSELKPAFERDTDFRLVIAFGPSVASAPDSVYKRLHRGERADVIILAKDGLSRLAEERQSPTSSVDALRRTLLTANSIAYSSSLSGVIRVR